MLQLLNKWLSWRALMALAAPVFLASCDSAPETNTADFPPASPALWQVSNPSGEVEGWLFGTIHALPDDVDWRTNKLAEAIKGSELLVVEISGLDDSAAMSRTFGELALSDGLPPLTQRVNFQHRRDLSILMAKGGYKNGDFTATESWAAALMLAQVEQVGDPQNGVDRALIVDFASKPVLELEGARKQLEIFDGLSEKDQRDLLSAVVVEGARAEKESPAELAAVWLAGDMDRLAQENTQGMLADPELHKALLTGRNQSWGDIISRLMSDHGPMMIAVGAAHMAGEEGIPALLTARGFKVERIQ